jgi:hypothetical protein
MTLKVSITCEQTKQKCQPEKFETDKQDIFSDYNLNRKSKLSIKYYLSVVKKNKAKKNKEIVLLGFQGFRFICLDTDLFFRQKVRAFYKETFKKWNMTNFMKNYILSTACTIKDHALNIVHPLYGMFDTTLITVS